MDREGMCTGEGERPSRGKWQSKSNPAGEAARAGFQVVLVALLTP